MSGWRRAVRVPGRWLVMALLVAGTANVASGPLSDAARDRDQSRLMTLLEAAVDVDERDANGATALHWAAFHGDRPLAEKLLALGASVRVRVPNGNTPLHHAAYGGHADVAALLLDHGAPIDARADDGSTPLHWAARNGHASVVALLLRRGANASLRNAAGDSAADLALRASHDAALRLLETGGSVALLPTTPPSAESTPIEKASGSSAAAPRAGDHRVQVAAVADPEAGNWLWTSLRQRFPAVLAEHSLQIVPVVRGNEVRFYRVQIGPMTGAEARRVCDALAAAGQDCLVLVAR
ncbi:MAG: ankyrin repeat domain-containing protein [Ectothiorhodospiraceae bacterium]|nr:ankyrin repeat domain-containing protein [Ectothiorhodospiraceae bacterium]